MTPDYIVPNGFFIACGDPCAGPSAQVNCAGVDVFAYGGALPRDGTHSLLRTGARAVNSPRNFAGATGTIALPVGGDFDGDNSADLTVWRASTGGWHILKSHTNYTTSINRSWGLSTDTPILKRP